MENNDLTVAILREIRDSVRDIHGDLAETNARLDQTNARLDQANARLEEQTDRLDRRITESEVRTATAINGLKGTMDEIRDLLSDRLDLRDRVSRCEHEIDLLKARARRRD